MNGGLSYPHAMQRTVGTYSLGNLFVVYEIKRQVYRRPHAAIRQSEDQRGPRTNLSYCTISHYYTLDCLHSSPQALSYRLGG